MLSLCTSQVSATVSKRPVACAPFSLRLPKQILRHCTPVRSARSALLLVGSTPSCSRKVKSRPLCSKRALARLRTSRWGLSKCCSASAKIRFWMSIDRSSSWRRSIWPLRNLCHNRKSLACWAKASRQNLSTALDLVNSTIPSRLRFRCAQQTDQDFAAARGGHRVDYVPRRHKGPQEAFVAVGSPARLIDIQHG